MHENWLRFLKNHNLGTQRDSCKANLNMWLLLPLTCCRCIENGASRFSFCSLCSVTSAANVFSLLLNYRSLIVDCALVTLNLDSINLESSDLVEKSGLRSFACYCLTGSWIKSWGIGLGALLLTPGCTICCRMNLDRPCRSLWPPCPQQLFWCVGPF